MNPHKLVISLCFLCLILSRATAPLYELNLAERFYSKVEGGLWARKRAYDGFVKFPAKYGHTQEEIWELIDKETAGKFHVTAYNRRTHARGLMQIRTIALKDIPNGWQFFTVSSNKRSRLKKKRVYDPYYNIQAGCSYYRMCKKRARPQKIGEYEFTREQMAKLYYVAGIGTWRGLFRSTLVYIQ